MRDARLMPRLTVTVTGAAVFLFLAGCSVEAGSDSAAQALADQFAKEVARSEAAAVQKRSTSELQKLAGPAPQPADDAIRKADEAEMLARARAEAEQRRAELDKARAEAERADRQRKEQARRERAQAQEAAKAAEATRRAEAERKAEADRKEAQAKAEMERARAEEERRWLAEAQRKAEEEAKSESARLMEIERKAEQERRAAALRAEEEAKEAARKAEGERKAEEERRLAAIKAEQKAQAAEARRVADEERRRTALAAERDAEAQRLVDRLDRAREERAVRLSGRQGLTQAPLEKTHEQRPYGLGGEPDKRLAGRVPDTAAYSGANSGRVTVLLLMQPGNYGIRRHNKLADPVLCSSDGCYVSNGPQESATFFAGHRALGLGRTFGARAGACSNSLGCVFRDIELSAIERYLGPVDMRVIRHDRREVQYAVSVSDCRLERGRLACRRGIHAADYAVWIVPESLAEVAGPGALETALDDGLPETERIGLGSVRPFSR